MPLHKRMHLVHWLCCVKLRARWFAIFAVVFPSLFPFKFTRLFVTHNASCYALERHRDVFGGSLLWIRLHVLFMSQNMCSTFQCQWHFLPPTVTSQLHYCHDDDDHERDLLVRRKVLHIVEILFSRRRKVRLLVTHCFERRHPLDTVSLLFSSISRTAQGRIFLWSKACSQAFPMIHLPQLHWKQEALWFNDERHRPNARIDWQVNGNSNLDEYRITANDSLEYSRRNSFKAICRSLEGLLVSCWLCD